MIAGSGILDISIFVDLCLYIATVYKAVILSDIITLQFSLGDQA
jgi:hypothetical protein